MKYLSIVFLLVTMLSCTSTEEDPITCTYAVKSADGFVTNRPWIFREGRAVPRTTTEGYEVKLFDVNEIEFTDICNYNPDDLQGIELTFFVGTTAEEIPIGGANLLFILDNAFDTSSTLVGGGCVKVEAITETIISGSISFDSSGDSAEGQWTARICN